MYKKKTSMSIREFIHPRMPEMKKKPVIAYSLVINPLALIDPTFLFIGVGVVVVALAEKKLADSGFISIASFISSTLQIAIPVVAMLALVHLIQSLSIFL